MRHDGSDIIHWRRPDPKSGGTRPLCPPGIYAYAYYTYLPYVFTYARTRIDSYERQLPECHLHCDQIYPFPDCRLIVFFLFFVNANNWYL